MLLDENITPELVGALRDEGIEAATARDLGLPGAGDARVLLTAARRSRTLVTADLDDFWNLHEAWIFAMEQFPIVQAAFAARAIAGLFRSAPPLADSFYRWTRAGGWGVRTVSLQPPPTGRLG